MTRPLLSFVAIFKDEAANVRKTLESVRPYVDRWTVLDTGSTDGTPDIVREVMAGVPGIFTNEQFVDYSTTRNSALALDQRYHPTVFTIMLSADEVLQGGEALRAFLDSKRKASDGAYCVTMRSGNRSWPYTRVLRTDSGWRYVGVIQERPVGPGGEVFAETIPGVTIVHTESDPVRKLKRLRERDLPLLTKEVEDQSKSLAERTHAMFFLAETHAALAAETPDEPGGPRLTHVMQSMSYYFRYAQIAEREGVARDTQKAMYAYFMYLHVSEMASFYTPVEMIGRLEPIINADPDQPEAKFLIAKYAAQVDVRQGLMAAEEAAKTACEARSKNRSVPTDVRIEAMSYLIAAKCAQALKRDDYAKKLAERAVAGGVSQSAVEGI